MRDCQEPYERAKVLPIQFVSLQEEPSERLRAVVHRSAETKYKARRGKVQCGITPERCLHDRRNAGEGDKNMGWWMASLMAVMLGYWFLGLSLVQSAAQSDCRTIENFSTAKIGEFPPGWKLRKDTGAGIYSVREENGLRFLRAISRGLGIQAAKQYEWDLKTHPVLAWSWRPVEFPKGADERSAQSNDSALAVYAVFPHSPFTVKSLKYLWSERVPRGTHLASSGGLTQVRVVRSGAEEQGTWVEERVNVLEDYRRDFGEAEVPKPSGIAVLTDSDDTKSSAQGDYANFRICRS